MESWRGAVVDTQDSVLILGGPVMVMAMDTAVWTEVTTIHRWISVQL